MGLRWRPGTCHWGLTFQESTKVDKSNQGEEWDGHTELWLSHQPTTMIASLDVSGNPRRIVSLYWVVDWKAAAVTLCRRLGVSSERKIFSAQSSCRLGTGLSKHGKGTKVKRGTHFEITWVISSFVDLQEKGERHFLLYTPISWFDLEWTLNWSIEITYKSLCEYRTQWMHRAECLACCCADSWIHNSYSYWIKWLYGRKWDVLCDS